MKIQQDWDEKYNIGKNIREIRMKRNLSQQQTCEKLELLGVSLSRGVLSHIETGRSNVHVKVLAGLADVFHAEIGDFFKGIRI